MQENRFHDRVPCHLQFGCKHYYKQTGEIISLGDCSDFIVENLSMGGLMARSQLELPMDAIIEYTLYLESVPYVVMSQVKWRTVLEGNQYAYGVAFLTISNMMYRHLKAFTSHQSFYQIDIPRDQIQYEDFEPLPFENISENLRKTKD